ncbi:MAG TPA: LapA family protein [Nitrospiria bacterium]|nr:LapA family protein [Nitrospiria bacterium]
MIRILILILVLAGAFTFMIENTEQTVQIRYLLGYSTPPLPVYQLVAGAFIGGMLLTGLLIFPEWIRMRLELRRQRKALQRIEEQMDRLRPPSPVMSSRDREAVGEGEES